jgi:hypothetical protein
LWVAFLDLSDSYFLFADLIGFYTHWTYMLIFSCIFLSNYWWQKSDIWLQALYRYPISWEVFFDPSDSYFLFAEELGYHKWALAHSSSCCIWWDILSEVDRVVVYNARGVWDQMPMGTLHFTWIDNAQLLQRQLRVSGKDNLNRYET